MDEADAESCVLLGTEAAQVLQMDSTGTKARRSASPTIRLPVDLHFCRSVSPPFGSPRAGRFADR